MVCSCLNEMTFKDCRIYSTLYKWSLFFGLIDLASHQKGKSKFQISTFQQNTMKTVQENCW